MIDPASCSRDLIIFLPKSHGIVRIGVLNPSIHEDVLL
jgi:hypothetical protein